MEVVLYQQNKMSHLRNRNNKSSNKFRNDTKFSIKSRNASPQIVGHNASTRIKTEPDLHIKSLYNQNISMFRPCFNQNDVSQLPFMATLRSYSVLQNQRKPTISQPFQASYKSTSNQKQKKRISDFKTKANRLAYAAYRWHNRTGRGSLWATDFQCSLRKYQQSNQQQRNYYSYVAPLNYKDVEQRIYQRNEMVCDHYHKSFKIKDTRPK